MDSLGRFARYSGLEDAFESKIATRAVGFTSVVGALAHMGALAPSRRAIPHLLWGLAPSRRAIPHLL
jgi:hypothetical protein